MTRVSESKRTLHLKPMRKPRIGTVFAALLLATFGLTACGGDSGGGGGDNNGQPPVAKTTCVFDQSTFDNCTIAQ